MMKRLSVFAPLLLLMCQTARADTPDDDLEARIRAYLLDHPEVIVEALTILSQREAAEAVAQKIAAYPDLFAEPPRHGLGAPDAPVRVIEFFDYKCVPCKAIHPKLEALVDRVPELRIEQRQLPILTPGSERAARFALAVRAVAGDDAYARVHEALWAVRGPLNTGVFARIADEQGLDFTAIDAAMDTPAITDRINRNRDVAIDLGILGTPAFVTPRHVSFGQADVDDLADAWLSR